MSNAAVATVQIITSEYGTQIPCAVTGYKWGDNARLANALVHRLAAKAEELSQGCEWAVVANTGNPLVEIELCKITPAEIAKAVKVLEAAIAAA